MTAYAPPDVAYFSGLQFNPNIYENTLVKSVNRLYGAVITIIGTISTIFTTPLFEVIQGSTTTLNMIEASTDFINTSYFKVKAPNIYLSPLGTWAALTCNSSLTQFYNPTQVTVSSPGYTQTGTLAELQATTTTITGDTANLSSYTTNINGTLTAVSSPTTSISGTLITLSAVTVNIGGTTTNLTAATTNISGSLLTAISTPTTTVTGTTTNLNATTKNIGGVTTNISSTTTAVSSPTTTITGTTTNLNATTTNIGGTTLNMNSTTTAFPDTTSLTFFSTNGGYPFYDSGNRYILVSGATTISNFTTTFDTLFVVPYTNGTTFQISLQGTAGNVNSGNSFRIFNNGSAAITIATSNSTSRLVGPAIARVGASSYSLGSNGSVRIQTLIPSGSPFNQTAANSGAYFLSVC